MSIYLDDGDFRLHVGDVRHVLTELPDASVDCVVTSPPYFGLRDYGTAAWQGGDPGCDHTHETRHQAQGASSARAGRANVDEQRNENFRGVCGRCGAERVDQQIGLEATVDEYVEQLFSVFREVHRVLAPHGTVWLNLGDSYVSDSTYSTTQTLHTENGWKQDGDRRPNVQRKPQVRDNKTGHDSVLRPPASPLPAKNLVGVPWRVALALQDDGWILRSDVIWSKPNPMPESVTDRPTKSHEYVFLLVKRERYYFDQEAVRDPFVTTRPPGRAVTETDHYGTRGGNGNSGLTEHLAKVRERLAAPNPDQPTLDESLPPEAPRGPDGRRATAVRGGESSIQHRDGERWPNDGRNIRTVWEIPTLPYKGAHFATYPVELVRRCVEAGCPEQVCRTCGQPRQRVVERGESHYARIKRESGREWEDMEAAAKKRGVVGVQTRTATGTTPSYETAERETIGWSDCGHGDFRQGVVLDPFIGSGTSALVARSLGRHAVGIELNPEYAALCAQRCQQLSLLT